MRIIKLIFLLILSVLFISCAAVGVPHSNDPKEKLYYAEELMNKGRALPAERLISEAILICKERNDSLCLGESYSTYSYFLGTYAVERYADTYKKRGFHLDKSITYENRILKSIEYYEKAISKFLEVNRYDMITNSYVLIGNTYDYLEKYKLACEAYDKSLLYNKKFFNENPKAKISLPKGFSSFKQYIDSEKKRSNCMK